MALVAELFLDVCQAGHVRLCGMGCIYRRGGCGWDHHGRAGLVHCVLIHRDAPGQNFSLLTNRDVPEGLPRRVMKSFLHLCTAEAEQGIAYMNTRDRHGPHSQAKASRAGGVGSSMTEPIYTVPSDGRFPWLAWVQNYTDNFSRKRWECCHLWWMKASTMAMAFAGLQDGLSDPDIGTQHDRCPAPGLSHRLPCCTPDLHDVLERLPHPSPW